MGDDSSPNSTSVLTGFCSSRSPARCLRLGFLEKISGSWMSPCGYLERGGSQRICGGQELSVLLFVLQWSPGSRCPSARPCPAPRSSQGCSPPPSEWQFGNFGGVFLTGQSLHVELSGVLLPTGIFWCGGYPGAPENSVPAGSGA